MSLWMAGYQGITTLSLLYRLSIIPRQQMMRHGFLSVVSAQDRNSKINLGISHIKIDGRKEINLQSVRKRYLTK